MSQRRLLTLLVVLGLIAVPAAALRATCAVGSCTKTATSTYVVPFCALPRETRSLIAAGYDEQTSPDVVAVAGGRGIAGTVGGTQEEPAVPWPSLSGHDDRVPIVLFGRGIRAGPLDAGTGLQDVTPSVERVLGLSPPPVTSGAERLGEAVDSASRADTRLILEVVWRGVGSTDLRGVRKRAPFLWKMLENGAGTIRGTTGSLPVDPAATLTSLGTGTLPSQHAIIGTYLRSPYDGSLVRAWNIRTTPTAVSTLANEMAHQLGRGSRQVVVATDTADRGVVGGAYYAGSAAPHSIVRPGPPSVQEAAGETAIRSGLGHDGVPDLLVVVMQGSIPSLDEATARLVSRATAVSRGALTTVIAGTGSLSSSQATSAAAFVKRLNRVEPGVVDVATPSGLFLRPDASAQDVADTVASRRFGATRAAEGVPGYAIALAEFC